MVRSFLLAFLSFFIFGLSGQEIPQEGELEDVIKDVEVEAVAEDAKIAERL